MRMLLFSSLVLCLVVPCLGCAARAPAPQPSASALPARITGVYTPRSGGVHTVPDALSSALEDAATARGLSPQPLPDDLDAVFGQRRSTPHRMGWVVEQGAGLAVLVEADVTYTSLLAGRYRWTVTGTATVAMALAPEQAVSVPFNVPVFLRFHHQREADALAEAAPVIAHHVGVLLDDFLAGVR